MASVDDLKEENWPESHYLTYHDAIAKLLGGKQRRIIRTTDEPYDIDSLSARVDTPIPSKVLEADASQYSAVIDVMKEENTVIQGPPGTGKSQTIANIIAAAVESGKSVLFVAEKIPALQVVANRLKANLGPLLFELYKGKNIEIIESAKASVEAREEIQQNYNENDLTRVKEEISVRIDNIKDYKELIYETDIFDDLKLTNSYGSF